MSKRIIKISNQNFYYTVDNFVTLSQTNFPIDAISFKTEGPRSIFYWEVEIISYDKLTKFLRIKVTDYTSDKIAQFSEQEAKETFNKLMFEELEWSKLEPCLSSYIKSSLWHLLSYKSKSDYNESIANINDNNSIENNRTKIEFNQMGKNNQELNNFDDPPTPARQPRIYNKEFRIPIKDAVFIKDFVSIHYKFDFYISKIELKVYNSNILPEYNYIKKFFHKILKRTTFTIVAEIKIDSDDNITTNASSPEIEAINEDFIQRIKQKQIQRVIKTDYNPELTKYLFTADELLLKDDAGNIFEQDEQNFIQFILDMKNGRNKRQLEYLSGHNLTEKILITQKPNFGFIFFIKGVNKYHFCWELLNSHATYFWSFENSNAFENQLNQMESEISIIQKNGRNDYKINAKNHEGRDSFDFNIINHLKIETETEDSFNNWKQDLLKLII